MTDALDQLERNILSNSTPPPAHVNTIAHRNPKTYQFFLTITSIIGYTFIFGFPITTLLLAAFIPNQIITAEDFIGVSVIFIEIATALITASLSITLFQLKPIAPSGRPLSTDEAPKLFSLIDELNLDYSKQKLQPKIHQIKISQHYELKIIRTPRNGFPLFFTNTLIIGLPFLQCHSPKQLKTLMALQIIHLSGARSRLSSWLFFSGSYWQQYNFSLKKQVKSPNIFLLFFFSWFSPLYNLLAQGAEKLEHYYVDQLFSKKIGCNEVSDAIIQSYISEKYLDDLFWPNLNNKAYRHKTPPYMPYASIERNLKSKLDDITRQSWLDSALNDMSESACRPSLLNRLKKLNINSPKLPGALQISSAEYFLDDTLYVLIHQMDKVWSMSNQFTWQKKYIKGQTERIELKELHIQAEQGLLSDSRIWDYIQLIKRYKDEQQAAELYKDILKLNIQDARISFEIGQTLLEQMDNDGIEAIEKSIQQETGYTVMACKLLTRYYSRMGDNRAAQSCRRRALEHQVNSA
ncbi:hypothetical protein MNBD_GAMMA09-3223 [hydrothermal vent metagenome]|uniref:Peptidase M48 domain-containing protein n=1 Tax=hydrothermal vent metagenome TaxID=652676 RepID=A0A3B0Y4M3_9ZZZZ